jgi:hypothetical protein
MEVIHKSTCPTRNGGDVCDCEADFKQSKRVTIHLIRGDKCWEWYKEKDEDNKLGSAKTKKLALAEAKVVAKSFYPWGQLIVHKKNGQFQTEYTYGNDPTNSKG